MPKVSIIVPVYKVEEYLPKCVDSILNQTFKDFELLLIDDGSPDKSGTICEEYAIGDSRIRVFHKKNGGVSSARNYGLDKATGEYVMFVDSDDEIAPVTIQRCYTLASSNGIDLLQYSLTRRSNELGILKGSSELMSVLEYINKKFLIVGIGGSFIKRSIIEQHSTRFNESLKLAEDLIFIHTILASSDKCLRLFDILYYYRDNTSSSSNNQKTVDMIKSCKEELKLKQMLPQFASSIDYSVTHYILSIIINNDYDYNDLYELIKLSLPHNRKLMSGTQLVFALIANINIHLAIKIVKWKYNVK